MQNQHEQLEQVTQPSRNGFLMGLLCGAALGAAVGLLAAPKSGMDLRKQMADSARRAKRRATDAYDGASKRVGDVVTRSRRAYEGGRDAFVNAKRPEGPGPSELGQM
jgi:YtxH-like protein